MSVMDTSITLTCRGGATDENRGSADRQTEAEAREQSAWFNACEPGWEQRSKQIGMDGRLPGVERPDVDANPGRNTGGSFLPSTMLILSPLWRMCLISISAHITPNSLLSAWMKRQGSSSAKHAYQSPVCLDVQKVMTTNTYIAAPFTFGWYRAARPLMSLSEKVVPFLK